MADDGGDRESKTEQATPRRIEDALDKGNAPHSREIGHAGLLLAAGVLAPSLAAYAFAPMASRLALLWDRSWDIRLTGGGDALGVMAWVVEVAGPPLLVPLAVLMIVGAVASLAQVKPRLVPNRIIPEFSRISPSKGLARLVSLRAVVELGKAAVKAVLISLAAYWVLRTSAGELLGFARLRPDDLPTAVTGTFRNAVLAVALPMVAFAILDLLWTRFKWRDDLRMTREEIKEEHKQAEGDPIVRAKQRSLAREQARRRMIAAVPRATLVVVNPTHYAVAMRYVHGESETPMVLAKGLDHLALRIREIAEAHAIPVVENKELARSLHAVVVTDRPIPAEFYKAVADIILFLWARQRTKPVSATPQGGPAAR